VDPASGRLFVSDSTDGRVLSWANAAAQANGQPADLVIGQPNLLALGANNGGRSATSLDSPAGMAVDALGNLYVADYANNRVLEYNAPLSTGMAASHVFGQGGSFTTGSINNGGISANSLNGPQSIALDAHGNLYAADTRNNRVLEYDQPLLDPTADRVLGQADFTHGAQNAGGLGGQSLYSPAGVALDGAGNLYVADFGNNRILEYDAPLATHQAASRVYGQADFTHNLPNHSGLNETGLSLPAGLAVDGAGNLYVADFNNNRVLEYDGPLADPAADRVFGQPNFNQNTANNGGVGPGSLNEPAAVATDGQRNLYVVDLLNNRVLEYDWAVAKIELPLMLR
jgi:sugar lactone lactonase YvrE